MNWFKIPLMWLSNSTVISLSVFIFRSKDMSATDHATIMGQGTSRYEPKQQVSLWWSLPFLTATSQIQQPDDICCRLALFNNLIDIISHYDNVDDSSTPARIAYTLQCTLTATDRLMYNAVCCQQQLQLQQQSVLYAQLSIVRCSSITMQVTAATQLSSMLKWRNHVTAKRTIPERRH